MNKIIIALALALATLVNVANAVDTATLIRFKSLQPFKVFPGAGEGVAYEYKARTKTQFVALLRDKGLAKKEMRVSCDVLVKQMMEAHPGLPFEGCEGAAAAIERDNDFVVVACRDEMFQWDNWVTVTNPTGSVWSVWHRKCLIGEQVLVYKNEPVISLTCLNVAIPVSKPVTTPVKLQVLPPAIGVIAKCPEMYWLKVNIWEHKALKLPGVALTHVKEELWHQFVGLAHVSSRHGEQFRMARADGLLQHSTTPRAFRVSLIMTPESQDGAPIITAEEVLGDIVVTGLYELQFTRKQLEQWDAIRLVAINGDVVSPPRYSKTGLREIRFFNRLPRTKLGEWDANPVPDCIMNEHWIE